jgi:DHA1 family tetracycline resistance protein-like MFS transporter
LSVLAGLYGLFVLPESLPPEQRAPLTWRAIHPVAVVRGLWRDYPVLVGWQGALFLMMFAISGVNSIFLLYVLYRFGWTPKSIGLYSTVVVLAGLTVQSLLVARAIKWLGERGALVWGTVVQTAAVCLSGFAVTGVQFTLAVLVMTLGGVADPARTAIMNRIIGPSDRGRLSGASRSIVSLTGVIAPAPFALLFAAVSKAGPASPWSGAPFFVCAAVLVASLAVTLRSLRRTPEAAAAAEAG